MAKLPSSSSSFALDFLRRLLCAHSHSTGKAQRDAPAGHLSAPEPEGRSPCIVARLMGLDAMPAADAQPQLLRRSRSASSVEEERSLPCGLGEAAPAVVRPSASLREKPAYLRAENDMFLLLSFSPEERGATKKKADDDEEEEAERRRENISIPGGARKQRRARRRRRKLQFGGGDDDDESGGHHRECNAQSSSPVSVLEAQRDAHDESSTTTTTTSSSSLEDADPCSATSSEEAHFASEQQQSCTRKLPHTTSLVQLDDTSTAAASTFHASSTCSDSGDRRSRRMVKDKSSDVTSPNVSGVWHPVCRLVEEDLKNMEWLIITRRGAGGVVVDQLGEEMDSEILDQLICEATVELVQLSAGVVVDALCPPT